MPRKPLIRTDAYYYHVTTRSNHKDWFCLPLVQVWKICILSLKKANSKVPAVVSQFVLMANHYHLLIRTPDANLDQFMFWFNKTFSDYLRRLSGKENRMFGSNYKWSLVSDQKYLHNVFRYIYQNPMRAGIVDNCQDYPYSTHFYTSRGLKVPFTFEQFEELESAVDFLNERIPIEKQLAIGKGLKRTKFKEVVPRRY